MSSCFFFNDTATTEIYTLSLHDALPIYESYHICAVVDAYSGCLCRELLRRRHRRGPRLLTRFERWGDRRYGIAAATAGRWARPIVRHANPPCQRTYEGSRGPGTPREDVAQDGRRREGRSGEAFQRGRPN